MARIDLVTTAGTFSLDGEDFDVEDNIWIVGDDSEVLVVDAAHDHRPILAGIADRRVNAIVCTHGHNDHINAAADLADATGAPIALHPDDRMLWAEVYAEREPDMALSEGGAVTAGGVALSIIHTPGHTPGGVCLYDGEGDLFGGDTLFKGGPGATGRKYSDFPTIIESIRSKLFVLPPETVVHPGHGDTTTIGEELPHLEEWIERGY
ncbi:MAG: MBL fold metallo-hydrolase [Actinobacteria bacterium]|nr:MBL fold metallo-hydrolase [Actinomycetota bacterium]